MSGFARETTLMPSIKCSSCGQQVEISMMGEHLCRGGADSVNTNVPFNKGIHDIGGIPPVDTIMANRASSRPPLTPLSMSGTSRSASPRTPLTRPIEYFTPQIANDDNYTAQSGLRPGGYGGFGEAEADSMYSSSPKKPNSAFGAGRTNMFPPRSQTARPTERNDSVRRGDNARGPAFGQDERRPSTSSGGNPPPPRATRNNGYGGFDAPAQRQDAYGAPRLDPPIRAGTFPRPSQIDEVPVRTPSAPPARSGRDDSSAMRTRRMTPDTSRPPPPRQSSVQASRVAVGKKGSINLADEFGIGNPYHSPSASESSTFSEKSAPNSSSNTSPARSTGRQPSDASKYDDVLASSRELQSTSIPDKYPSQRTDTKQLPQPVETRDPSTRWQSPRRQDPAIQGGIISPSSDLGPDSRSGSGTNGSSSNRPSTSRGSCRACNLTITGKSISSADGRLTGRYHKACFVCTTCREPFSTAEFYVHTDKPFCKRHYHQVNGSCCGTCNDGIEGQYLEDESNKKHHVDCFRCGDCNLVLRDGYFEVEGRVYCERDALRRLQPPAAAPAPRSDQQRGPSGGRGGMNRSGGGPPPSRGAYMSNGNGGRPPIGGPPPRGGLPARPVGAGGPAGRPGPNTAQMKLEKRRTRIGMM